MLTDLEMLKIAERYLKSIGEHFGGADIEVMVETDNISKNRMVIFIIMILRNIF